MDIGFTFLIFNDSGFQPDGLTVMHWTNLTEPSTQREMNIYLVLVPVTKMLVWFNEHGSHGETQNFSSRSSAETA